MNLENRLKSVYNKKIINTSFFKGNQLPVFWLLIAPSVILITAFILYPVFNTLFYSVYKWNGFGPLVDFQGFRNFERIFSDQRFWNALKNSGIIVIFSIVFQLPIAFMLALIISRNNSKGIIVFRTIFFLPFIFSEIITGTIWTFIYHPTNGVLNYFFEVFFPNANYTGLLSSPDTVFGAILFVVFWKYFGFHLIIYVAGMQGIPKEYYEAARIDGAKAHHILRHITLPLMKPALQMSLFFSIIGSIQIFDMVWAMGQGDPVHAGETAVVYLFKFAIKQQKLGLGSAIAIIIFLICLVFNIFYQKVINEEKA
ncbi:MAG: sugar ABC transporter permease [Spirochaetales bacterium]|nr:sugar ABC transporter permease [Spirochaetales bacterium]